MGVFLLFDSQGYPSTFMLQLLSLPNNSTCFSCSCLSSCILFTFSPLLGPGLCCRNVACGSRYRSLSIKEGVGMLYLSSWVFLCSSTRKSSLLLLLPPLAASTIPISQASLSTLTAVPTGLPALCGTSGFVWPCLSCAVPSLSFLGYLSFLECPRFCVAAILQCLHGDASPMGSTLSWR